MKKLLEMATLAVLGVLLFAQFGDYEKENYMYEATLSVYQIEEAGGRTGSGVMISPTRMLTAAHTFDLGIEGAVVWVDDKEIPVDEVMYLNREVDIAVLSVSVGCPCARVARREPYILEDIFAVGYPAGSTIPFVTEGKYQGMVGLWQSLNTAQAAPGSSGGGVFSIQGGKAKLTGITANLAGTSVRYRGIPGPPAAVPVYYIHGAVSLEQIKQAMLCADGIGGDKCEDPLGEN